jgi:hypothetical protein
MYSTIPEFVASGSLPKESDVFFRLFVGEDGKFIGQEGETWDFKESWPASYSDSYFSGIVRLICAFSNTNGGVIVFGVDDETRSAGHNKVKPNTDRLELVYRQMTGFDLKYDFHSYDSEKYGKVFCLLIHRKPMNHPPHMFVKSFPGYREGIIWVRRGSEVRAANADDIPIVYLNSDLESAIKSVPGQLPASPSTVRSFVGRMETINKIFRWFFESDEPRTFLWGKGGSGKSTIAHEVFKNIKEFGYGIRIGMDDVLEQVIFVTAKKTYLNPGTLKADDFAGKDFSDQRELLQSILILGQSDSDDIFSLSDAALRKRVQEYFDVNSCFIVIDDIDTLTTAGEDAGLDLLYRMMAKAKKSSKVLYTLRNRPTHSLSNAIEVPGMNVEEFDDFVRVCSEQFGVPAPSEALRSGRLKEVSESRPLVLESIIALRRNSGNYENAIAMFEQSSGEDVRSYVFEREWQSLDAAERGREILALIALYKDPIGYTDLCTVSKMDRQKVSDALSSVQEMFLQVDNNGKEQIYSLGSLTSAFVESSSKKLDFYNVIRTRVEKFKSTFYKDSPEINSLYSKFEYAKYRVRHSDRTPIIELMRDLLSDRFGPEVSEDPRFLALRAAVALYQNPMALDQARRDFDQAFAFKFSPDADLIRDWFDAERLSDLADRQTKHILETVKSSKGYGQDVRVEFVSRRASFLYNFARASHQVDREQSWERLFEAVDLHLIALYSRRKFNLLGVSKTTEHGKNTSFFLIKILSDVKQAEKFFSFIVEGVRAGKEWYVDPLLEPVGFMFQSLEGTFLDSKADLNRIMGRVETLKKALDQKSLWCDQENRKNFSAICAEFKERLKRRLAALR